MLMLLGQQRMLRRLPPVGEPWQPMTLRHKHAMLRIEHKQQRIKLTLTQTVVAGRYFLRNLPDQLASPANALRMACAVRSACWYLNPELVLRLRTSSFGATVTRVDNCGQASGTVLARFSRRGQAQPLGGFSFPRYRDGKWRNWFQNRKWGNCCHWYGIWCGPLQTSPNPNIKSLAGEIEPYGHNKQDRRFYRGRP